MVLVSLRSFSPLPRGEGKGEGESSSLCAFFLRCYEIGFVDLHTCSPHFVTEISDRPLAAPLARYQAGFSDVVPTPHHTTLKVDGPIARKLVRLLDGTNDRAALLQKLSADERSFDAEALDSALRHLARAGVLIG